VFVVPLVLFDSGAAGSFQADSNERACSTLSVGLFPLNGSHLAQPPSFLILSRSDRNILTNLEFIIFFTVGVYERPMLYQEWLYARCFPIQVSMKKMTLPFP
jgi:hypothetical protein